MNIKKRIPKFLPLLLSFTIVSGNVIPAYAMENTNSDSTTVIDGEDIKTDERNLEDITVTYKQASSFFVTIPKTIVLDGWKQATYAVKVSGDIGSEQCVYVAPVDGIVDSENIDFYMKDLGGKKADVAATVTQNKVRWSSEDIANAYEEINNSVSAPNLTAGTWEGTFQMEIKLETHVTHKHNYVETITKEPTCTEAGEKTFTCDCGDSYTEEIPAKGHKDTDGDGICDECGEKEPVAYKEFVLTAQNYTMAGISRTGVVEIPSEFDYNDVHYRTVEIGANAFRNCKDLINITIPDSVTNIENLAFCGCTNLSSVTIPDSVTHIGSSAFSDCTSLEYIEIPDSVVSFHGGTFDGETFNGCSKLKSVKLPANMTHIPRAMFRGCTSLTNITLPDSITSIDNGAFNNCTSLTNIRIPNGVTSIGIGIVDGGAFSGCTSLTSIIIPNSVTHIGGHAFEDCTNLKSIIIPDSVTDIECFAFCRCKGLTSMTIPSSITSIDRGVFSGCTNLSDITIPDSITSIGGCAFQECTSLKTIYIPLSVTTISASSVSDLPFRYLSALKIYCGASEEQSGWERYWRFSGSTNLSVTYGVTRTDYEANYKET